MSEQNFDMYSASIEGALVLFLMPWFSFIPICFFIRSCTLGIVLDCSACSPLDG